MYEGVEYDYVFTVELDGQPSLKLPYNVSDDPWMAAHNWLEKHELGPLFLGNHFQCGLTEGPPVKANIVRFTM